jgi:hypothetical protein
MMHRTRNLIMATIRPAYCDLYQKSNKYLNHTSIDCDKDYGLIYAGINIANSSF